MTVFTSTLYAIRYRIYWWIHRYKWSLLDCSFYIYISLFFRSFFISIARLPALYRDTEQTVCVRGLRNAFSLYDGYFKYAACTTSCYTGGLADTRSRKKRKRGPNCDGACNTFNAVSIITLVLTLNCLFGKLLIQCECRNGKNAGNFICNWYTKPIGYMQPACVLKESKTAEQATFTVVRDNLLFRN